MLRRLNIFLFVSLIPLSVVCQLNKYSEAEILYLEGSYSAAQALFQEMISENIKDESIFYYNAKCAKYLFANDAVDLYESFLEDFPTSSYHQNVYEDLAFLYLRDLNYNKAINNFLLIENFNENPYLIFNIAYSYFSLDSLENAQYYFSKIINIDSKYSTPAQYYFSHIAYENGLYNSAMEGFEKLVLDEKFGPIVPYYIAQIHFFQKNYKKLISYVLPMLNKVIPSRKSELNRLLAESYYRTGQYNEAINFFNDFLSEQEEVDISTYFLLGNAYFLEKEYLDAIKFLEMVIEAPDSTMQYSSYILGASYLHLEKYHYALQAFKKSSSYFFDLEIKEEAFYNYAKLLYQLDMSFENTFSVFQQYLDNYFTYQDEINDLVLKSLQNSSKHKEAFQALLDLETLNIDQKTAYQRLAFYLGVKEYNKDNYRNAINYFSLSNKYIIDKDISYINSFWLADSYYKINDLESSIKQYSDLPVQSVGGSLYYSSLREYNLAYAYFKHKKYDLANKYFRNYEQVVSDTMRLHDTYLRIADCFFMQRQYSSAEKYYSKAIDFGFFDIDYAIYKRAQSLSLLGRYSSMENLLLLLANDYTLSSYYDDALHDLSQFYKYRSYDDLAIEYYNKLLSQTNDEKFIANAYLSKGMIYFKNSRVDDAINEFLYVVNNFQRTVFFKEALSGLQAAYLSLGNIDVYLEMIDTLPQFSISQAEQDSLVYNTAFMKFSENEFQTSSIAFNKYINRFEKGIFIEDAIYYNAISLLNIFDTSGAIVMYEKLVESSDLLYKKDAISFLARYYYSNKNYLESNMYYQKINKMDTDNALKRESIIRLMYLNESIDSTNAYNYAKEVLLLAKKDNWLISRAKLIIARYQFDQGNYSKSKITFSQVLKLSSYDEGAEAKYYLSYLTFLDDSLDLAEVMIFQLIEEYTNDYFVAKSFVLLSDIYVLKNNNFQAKATLESVIENCEIDELVNIARVKWERIVEKENYKKKDINHSSFSFIEITDEDIQYTIEEYDIDFNDTIKVERDSLNTIID